MPTGFRRRSALYSVMVVAGIEAALAQGSSDPENLRAIGEVRSREALSVVEDSASDYSDVVDKLQMLIGIVEHQGTVLTSETVARILDATRQRLMSEQEYLVVVRAIELAAALDDRPTLERIASNRAAVNALGFTESGIVDRIQQKAQSAL